MTFTSSDLQRSLHSSRHRSWQWPASCSKQAARATPKCSVHCKGPQDHLLTARYACFVLMRRKMKNNRDFTLSPVIYRVELDCRVRKKGKLSTSHRYDLLPLLRSSPGGIRRELVVYDFPDCKYSYFLSTCKIFTILNSFF